MALLSRFCLVIGFIIGSLGCASRTQTANKDLESDVSWLSDRTGDDALKWVKTQNAKFKSEIAQGSLFESLYNSRLQKSNSKKNIPYGWIVGKYYYSVFKNNTGNGFLTRIKISDFENKKSNWESVLDLEETARELKTNIILKSISCLAPENEKCLLRFKVGGSDKSVLREFNMKEKKFVDIDGFNISQAFRHEVSWINKNEILITRDNGFDSVSKSEYPLEVRHWQRPQNGQNNWSVQRQIKDELVYRASQEHAGVFLSVLDEFTNNFYLINDFNAFEQKVYYPWKKGQLGKALALPKLAVIKGRIGSKLIVHNKSNWSEMFPKIPSDAILSFQILDLAIDKPELVFSPPKGSFIQDVAVTQKAVWVNLLKNASSEIHIIQRINNKWIDKKVQQNEKGTISFEDWSTDGNFVFISTQGFLNPDKLMTVKLSGEMKVLATRERAFDPKGMRVNVYFAKSSDGTLVPYFVVTPKAYNKSKSYPTLMYGYGAAGTSNTPWYLGSVGYEWVSAGGVFVNTVIRGGGEFGYDWRQAGMKLKKQNTFDDFIAIANDLVRRGITTPQKLGAYGTSWGGLLVSASMVQRPDLFKAVAPLMPMTDMINFKKFPVGESWTGEFGDPSDPEVLKVLSRYSPLHNLKTGVKYPATLFVTSTNDDRMHPAHSRMMAEKLMSLGQKVYHYEEESGGHSGSSTKEESARRWASIFTFFRQELGLQ